jgi:hypothetical protein
MQEEPETSQPANSALRTAARVVVAEWDAGRGPTWEQMRALRDALAAPGGSPADLETQRLANEAMAGATQWTPMR